MSFTARDQIYGALRLIGQLAEGEVPSAATAQDSLMAMNQMIDSWNTERLSVFSTQDQVFSWPANVITRTLGPSGDFVGNRPVLLDDATYYKDSNNLSFGIMFINEDQYNGIALKTSTSNYPEVAWVNMDFPNISISVYPKPTQQLEWHFISVTELTQVDNLSTVLYFPPGYLRAFRFNLAVEIASEFGIEVSRQIQSIALTSKRNLKRINNPGDIMMMPYAIVNNVQRFNIYAGNY